MLACLLASLLAAPNPVSFRTATVLGLPVRVVETDTRDPRVTVGVIVSQGFPGGDEPFEAMLARERPKAAINGTYFDKGTKLTIGDVAIDGNTLRSGRMGTAFVVEGDGQMDIRRLVRHRTMDWSGTRAVVACGPALVLDGKIDVRWQEEGFRDPSVIGRTQRMAVGYRQDGTLVFAHILKSVSFDEEAKVMKALGCHEAMNLDGGASLAMYANGKTHQAAGRRLTNLIAVWVD